MRMTAETRFSVLCGVVVAAALYVLADSPRSDDDLLIAISIGILFSLFLRILAAMDAKKAPSSAGDDDVAAAITEHLTKVEEFGYAERGYQDWRVTNASNRALVLPGEKKKRDDAWQAVCESAQNLVAIAQDRR